MKCLELTDEQRIEVVHALTNVINKISNGAHVSRFSTREEREAIDVACFDEYRLKPTGRSVLDLKLELIIQDKEK